MNLTKLTILSNLGLVMGVLTAGSQDNSLTLRQAVDTALEKSPAVAAAHAEVEIAHAESKLSRTALFPSVHFVEDISRGDDPVYVFGTKLRQQRFTESDFELDVLNRPPPIGNFATRFHGTWTAFDWLKTQDQIRQADQMKKSATFTNREVDQQVVLNVVCAYQSVLYSERRIDVAQHELTTAQALLNTLQTRIHAGLAVESDLMSAQVNVSERTQELITAEGALDTSWAELENMMGQPLMPHPALKPIELHHFPERSLADEIAAGVKTRPDLQALHAARSAQTAAVRAAKADFGPQVNTYGNWEMDGPSFAGSGGNNWLAGVQLDIDILPLAKRAQLAQQAALQHKVDAQEISAEQQVRLAISRAHSAHQTAERSLATAQAVREQATESLRIVRNRYEAGLATITEMLRAEDAQRQNQTDYWGAVYSNVVAYAQLLYATGALTPESVETLQ